MPNIDNLMDTIQQTLIKTRQIKLLTFQHWIWNTLTLWEPKPQASATLNFSGDCTGTYPFITKMYGLTHMPAAFQKAMNYTLVGLNKVTYYYLDGFIIVSRGSMQMALCVNRLRKPIKVKL